MEEECAGAGDSNMLELMPRKRKHTRGKEQPAAPKLSKSMQRKLKRIEEEKEQRKKRKIALETLEECKLAEDVQDLIWSSSKADTMKEKLRWALRMKRAGLPVPEDIPLDRERPLVDGEEDEMVENDITDTTMSKATLNRVETSRAQLKETKPNNLQKQVESGTQETGVQSKPDTSQEAAAPKQIPLKASRTTPGTGVTALGECKKFVVSVLRSEDIEKQRSKLPIVMMEQEIMEALQENDVVIVCGETGCGKTTQVPQFLYEAGYGSAAAALKDRSGIIGVTQPRRIAVLTTAKRVAHELNLQLGKEVGFQVRHDRKLGEKSSIKFMTDGILLREVQSDFLLRKYSVLVLDEAHERSVNTDILIGMLSRIVPLRKKLHDQTSGQKKPGECVAPLKLIIMSATLRVEDFTKNSRMFPSPPPVIHVTARQFPVKIHSSRKTELVDYETAAFKKVCAIHKRLPPGGILVFLTGRREVESMCRRLRSTFPTNRKETADIQNRKVLCGKEFGSLDIDTLQNAMDGDIAAGEDEDMDWEPDNEDFDETESDSELSDVEEDEPEPGTVEKGDAPKQKAERKPEPLHVLPLYAMLPAAAQLQVFAAVPEGKRLVVVATNVAETSVTIPGIRYVVDCGRAKEKTFSGSSGLSKFEVSWISKASADQRAGRAGRTGPGHCYQLYSKTHYHNNFPDFAPPEISLIPIEGVILVLKCMGIDKVVNFPFPTPPEKSAMVEAEKCLLALGALDQTSNLPTAIGKSMVVYPVNPRHARMLIAAIQSTDAVQKNSDKQLIVACAVAMAAVLSVENPFVGEEGFENKDENAEKQPAEKNIGLRAAQAKFLNPSSDVLTTIKALSAYEQSRDPISFCKQNYLNEKIMKELTKLRSQLSRIACQYLSDKDTLVAWEEVWNQFADIKLHTRHEEVLLRAVCAGWPDRIARRMTVREKLNWQKISKRGIRYQAASMEEPVYLRPSSSVFKFAADYVVYKEIVQTTRPYMSCVSSISSSCLVSEASYFCTFSKPLEDPPPFYDADRDEVLCWVPTTFGAQLWQLPPQKLPVKNSKQRAGAFAFALLEGRVIPGFANLRPFLAMDPAMLLKTEAIVHKRVGNLLDRLETGGVNSRETLARAWQGNSTFLYEELLAWMQSKHQAQLKQQWEALRMESLPPSGPQKKQKRRATR